MADVIKDSEIELAQYIPAVVIHTSIAAVIWIFSKTFFIPLGEGLSFGTIKVSAVIAGIALFTILILLLKVMREIKDICDSLSKIATSLIIQDEKSAEFKITFHIVDTVIYFSVAMLRFLVIGGLLIDIHTAFTGIFLVGTFVIVVKEVSITARLVSERIDVWVKQIF